MDERKTIFDYLQHILTIFSVTIIILMVITKIAGESTKEVSSMFRLGSEGISLQTMAQFLALSALITIIRYLTFTEIIFKKLSIFMRTVIMLGLIIVVSPIFAVAFDWFPINSWEPWACFAGCFIICFVVSLAIMTWKTLLENKKMEEALKEFQKKREEIEKDCEE